MKSKRRKESAAMKTTSAESDISGSRKISKRRRNEMKISLK
jgi:hypothetical protein